MLAPMPAVSALRSHRRRQVLQECRTFRLTSGIPGLVGRPRPLCGATD